MSLLGNLIGIGTQMAVGGVQMAAGSLETAATLASLRGVSPADELAVARSGGFRQAVLALQKMSSSVSMPAKGGVQCTEVRVSERLIALQVAPPDAPENRLVLYFHGGAHCFCSPRTYAELLSRLAVAASARVVAVDYRLAPQNPFPAGLDDAVTAWRWASQQHPGAAVAVAGDSAGGNLAFALLVRLAQLGEPQPVACVGLSPWLLLDPERVGSVRRDSRSALSPQWGGDVIAGMVRLGTTFDVFTAFGELMAGKMHDVVAAQYFQDHPASNPLISPLLAGTDLIRHFPPILIHADKDEPLSADAKEMAALCQQAGVQVELELYSRTAHVFQFAELKYPDASRDSLARISAFLEKAWQSALDREALGHAFNASELAMKSEAQLRAILIARGMTSAGCVEKQDLIEFILAPSSAQSQLEPAARSAFSLVWVLVATVRHRMPQHWRIAEPEKGA
eukprot:CAMPEP_0179066222 /NCGR_PEP_ID=MMETSP0796-20121207/28866_1 /TAXON_ID=73915 /ORGANISM="Pyrodinium bahamense, Strain pbaha01" /LENGTH=452 /DNA_ID=CAMNT_0020763221 /DNA_START=25 /DNA_END=1380 /DNA_ORIENTATION=+